MRFFFVFCFELQNSPLTRNRAAQNICIEEDIYFGKVLTLNPATDQSYHAFNKLIEGDVSKETVVLRRWEV